MYTVLFNSLNGTDRDHQFMSGISDYLVARNIARNLEEEGFVAKAWVESE